MHAQRPQASQSPEASWPHVNFAKRRRLGPTALGLAVLRIDPNKGE